MKKGIVVFVVVAIMAAGVGWWLTGDDGERRLTLYGNVDIREVSLGFRVPGRLAGLDFEEGDPVAAGTVLALLDDRPYREDLAAAEAVVARAEAELKKRRAGSRPQEVERARALVAEARAALANAEQNLERQETLMAQDAGSQRALDQALAAQRTAEARVLGAIKTLELADEGFRAEEIEAAEAALAVERARLAQARTRLDDTRLLAPADGIIISRVREPGTILAAGAPVYTLSLRKPVWVRAYIDEPNLGRIHPGKKAWVKSDTGDNHYVGQVGFISPRAEFTPKTVQTEDLRTSLVYRLRIVIEGADEALRQGMPVTVYFDQPSDDS